MIEAVDENPVLRAWQIHHADATGGRILRDHRCQLGETQVPASGNRQLLDFCFRDEGACVRPRRFHDRRMRVQRDRFGHGCTPKRQIEGHALARQQHDVVLPSSSESVMQRGHLVAPGRKRREPKAALAIRSHPAVRARVDVGDGHGGLFHGLAGYLGDVSPDFTGAALCRGRYGAEESDEQHQNRKQSVLT